MMKNMNSPALARRAEVQRHALTMGIEPEVISGIVLEFYGKVRAHPVLGPVFDDNIENWDLHLQKMERFWRSVLLNTGEYSGKPVQAHLGLADMSGDLFPIWLRLFNDTLAEISPSPEFTAHLQKRAYNIAASLARGLEKNTITEAAK